MPGPLLIVVSEPDPVAASVASRWGTPESTGEAVEGAPIRRLSEGVFLLKRETHHIHDERLDSRLPPHLVREGVTLVFPSIHRSEQNVPCLTVHPLGNLGSSAEVGGRPNAVVPTDPGRMTGALRELAIRGAEEQLAATFEATHHGPELGVPAFFVE